MATEMVSDLERPVGEDCRDLRSIPGDKQADRLQIIQRLKRPLYFSHCAIRLRASSWLTS